MTSLSAALEVRGLSIAGGEGRSATPILSDISFIVMKRELVGIIGESGAGKSTLGLAALGFTRLGCHVTSGSVLLDGRDLFGLGATSLLDVRRTQVGYIAQSAASAFNPARKIISQVCEVAVQSRLMTRPSAWERAISLFRRLLLPDPQEIGNRYPHELSGGQLQRAMVAMAMMCRPNLLILDEPTSALDVTSQSAFLKTILDVIKEDGTTCIYISHDLPLLSQIVGRIIVMKDGRIVEDGTAEAVISRPSASYSRDLVQARRLPRTTGQHKPGAPMLLRVSDATIGYGPDYPILSDFSLELFKGDTLAVIGESGSGKTTLARAIAGLVVPTKGLIEIEGSIIRHSRDRSAEERRQIQLIHQYPDLALNPKQTVFDALSRPLRLFFGASRSECVKEVGRLLESVGLPRHFGDRITTSLSGGQKQRICIARALAARPRLLICDEFTSALDSIVAADIIRMVGRIRESMELSCLLITHDFSVVKALANRVVVLKKGKIVEEGEAGAVMSSPSNDYTAALLSSVPTLRHASEQCVIS